jgi:hypothetical protein
VRPPSKFLGWKYGIWALGPEVLWKWKIEAEGFMKALNAIAAFGGLVLATVGAHAASFIGQTVDGVLGTDQIPGVTTQFTSPIIAPGAFDGVMQDLFGQTWDVSVQVLSSEVIIEWTGNGNGNVSSPGVLTVDLSGYNNGPVLGLDTYSCTGGECGVFGGGPRSAA